MNKVDFTDTKAYENIKHFIYQVDNSIKEEKQLENLNQIDILTKINKVIENTPLDSSSHRFANNACLCIFEFLKSFDNVYLINSFGNASRMDYGTGHELNYFCYLFVLYKAGELKINEVFKTLKVYFRVVRTFIYKYNIEPAGSQGVWGIDDYQILPYLFGSSELFHSNSVLQESIHELNTQFCYVECFKSSKNKNSLVLNSFKNKKWSDINRHLLNMYDAQVFKKKVVTQHFIYSEYLPNTKK